MSGWDAIFGTKEQRDARDARLYATPEYADYMREEWEREHPVKQKRVRRPTLRQALVQASKAGVAVSGATIAPDGSVALMFGSGTNAPNNGNGHDIETAEELRGLI